MSYDIAIIGAGASGLMLASLLKNKRVCLIDSNATVGAKIRVSGGGKCNITNTVVTAEHYLGNKEFVHEILSVFDQHAFLNFCKQNGLFPFIDEKIVKGTYFCKNSKEVISMFEKLTSACKYFLNTTVKSVEQTLDGFTLCTNKQSIECKKLVVASGGLSFTNLGASCIAFDIAQQFSHKIIPTSPALVGFTVQKDQFWFKKLSGISLNVIAKVEDKQFEGSFLFAHKGCSGPVILNSSLYWKKGKMSLDFLPHKKIEAFYKSNKKISSALPLPKRFIQEFLCAIMLEDKPMSKLNEEERMKLKQLKAYDFSPAGNFGYSKAEVTRGGIGTCEIESNTMQSKQHKNLFFLGECLDVTGQLGGYNFQFAWSSAYVCAQTILKQE